MNTDDSVTQDFSKLTYVYKNGETEERHWQLGW